MRDHHAIGRVGRVGRSRRPRGSAQQAAHEVREIREVNVRHRVGAEPPERDFHGIGDLRKLRRHGRHQRARLQAVPGLEIRSEVQPVRAQRIDRPARGDDGDAPPPGPAKVRGQVSPHASGACARASASARKAAAASGSQCGAFAGGVHPATLPMSRRIRSPSSGPRAYIGIGCSQTAEPRE